MNILENEPNPHRIDMTGKRCGMLTVIGYAGYGRSSGQARWRCKCDCGKETTVNGYDLRSGKTKSCGCLMLKKYGRDIASG